MVIDKAVGIDVGLEHYAVDSDGNEVENPRHLKHELKKLRREQRRLSKKQKGSKNYEKQRIIIARTYERVENQRTISSTSCLAITLTTTTSSSPRS